MPPPRKVDLLPPELRAWLQDELRARGFGDYEQLADDLNAMLVERGEELRIQKSALHAYGQEYAEFARLQEQAGKWAEGWLQESGIADDAQRHSVLTQMVTTLAFKTMQAQMMRDGDDIDPRELHFLGRMLRDIMTSSGEREKLIAAERKAQAARLDDAVAAGDIDKEAAQKAREIMGFTE